MAGNLFQVAFKTIRAVDLSPMVKVDGVWVHQGVPDAGIDWERVIEDGREERLLQVIGGGFFEPTPPTRSSPSRENSHLGGEQRSTANDLAEKRAARMNDAEKKVNRVLGQHLLQARLLRGLSQADIGDLVGVSFQQIQKYEAGTNNITPARLKTIADALGVGVSYFFAEQETEVPMVGSYRRSLHIMHALQQIERCRPDAFQAIADMVNALAKSLARAAQSNREKEPRE